VTPRLSGDDKVGVLFPLSLGVPGSDNSWRDVVVADDRYDVIIIGTGAGGGTLAHRLAAAGKRILPSLAAIANALRVGDHLAARLG
jgi:hypothetical protein